MPRSQFVITEWGSARRPFRTSLIGSTGFGRPRILPVSVWVCTSRAPWWRPTAGSSARKAGLSREGVRSTSVCPTRKVLHLFHRLGRRGLFNAVVSKRILVVDDEPDIRNFLVQALSAE